MPSPGYKNLMSLFDEARSRCAMDEIPSSFYVVKKLFQAVSLKLRHVVTVAAIFMANFSKNKID
jgi:hypothetical protein